jgi:superfamily I DNA/RNA helicase
VNLSAEQARVIQSAARHKRVIAAAGSGKTRVIVAQAGAWLEAGASPETMAVISFTRRSGEELRRRISEEYGVSLGYVGTVHGMAYLALALGADGRHRLTPLSKQECNAVVDHIASECRMRSAVCPKVYKATQGQEINRASMSASQLALLEAVADYMECNRMVHVGALVERFVLSLRAAPDLLDWYRAHARTILWDEFQDTTREEDEALALAMPERSLVVGDPRQAIFGFRNARDDFLFMRPGEPFDVHLNFRSGAAILDAANRISSRHGGLVAFRKERGVVRSVPCLDGETIGYLADAVAEMDGQCHVLCRTNREVSMLRDALECGGVAAVAASPHFDRFAEPPWELLFLACRYIMDPSCEWLSSAMARAGLGKDALADVDPETEKAHELLTRLSGAYAIELAGEPVLDMSVVDFLAWYQRRDLEDLLPGEGDADVVLMTAHASKGLEFDRVILVDVGRRLGGDDDDEERNLLYVACTRAREKLVLIGDPATVSRLRGDG